MIWVTVYVWAMIALLIAVAVFTVSDIISNDHRDRGFKLKFSQFKKFYNVSPYSYKLCEYHVIKDGKYFIKFNVIDTFRYIYFKQQIKKNKYEASMRAQLREYLESVQNDINYMNSVVQEEISNKNS